MGARGRRGRINATLIATALLALTTASVAGAATVRTIPAAGMLRAVAADAQGNSYVAVDGAVRKYDANGNYVLSLAGNSPPLANLLGVAVAPAGDIYTVDYQTGNTRVSRYGPDGTFVSAIYTGSGAWGVDVDGSGNVYVVDCNTLHRVTKYDAALTEITHWDTPLDPYCSIAAADNGETFIARGGSPGSGRVVHFGSAGQELNSWNGPPNADFQGIGVSGDGSRVYVDNTRTDEVLSYSPSGNLLGSDGSTGSGPEQYKLPQGGIGVDGSGNVHIADAGNGRVKVVDPRLPIAALAPSANPVNAGSTVTLDASGSKVSFSSPTKYEWDLDGDGSFEVDGGLQPTIAHSYSSRRYANPAVRVTAPSGQTATASVRLSVGPLGVSINDGDIYTNDPNVEVSAVGPPAADGMIFSNDGGFGTIGSFSALPTVDWKLVSSGPERLPKTLYARFSGPGVDPDKTYQDDIILDETPPDLQSATLSGGSGSGTNKRAAASRRARGKVTLKLKASDKTSGVEAMQISKRKTKKGRWVRFKKSVKVKAGARIFVRVQDGAGNPSGWKRAR